MNAIVAVDCKWGIGRDNDLLFSIPEDMRYFREKTLNKVIVMGKNTLLSFPGSKPLKDRVNIVLSSGGNIEGCIVADSLEALSKILMNYKTDDIFIVGGAMFYQTMLNYCRTIYVTKIEKDGNAQVFFENLDENENFYLEQKSPVYKTSSGINISFNTYKNKNTKIFK